MKGIILCLLATALAVAAPARECRESCLSNSALRESCLSNSAYLSDSARPSRDTVSYAAHELRPRYDKLSPMLRRMARECRESCLSNSARLSMPGIVPEFDKQDSLQRGVSVFRSTPVCAFVKVVPSGVSALEEHGCSVLEQVGDICIAMIPKTVLGPLSRDSRIVRIEANRSSRVLNDTTALVLGASAVHEGRLLPQAFTGRGVVVGVMDVGFDLTHPTFYSRDTTDYRIRRFWDMLSADTLPSKQEVSPYGTVGRDYAGRDELLTLAHARDGLDQYHGTHTAGTAAGSGYDSPFGGMAPESDICLVANAVTSDTVFIAPEDYDKYTFALDALGFKYIFDYAESVGKPCVINFSEGSMQDFWGYDQLYYEMLERITGPGRIIVASAGNYGAQKNWIRKNAGEYSAGTFLQFNKHEGMVTLKGDRPFDMQMVAYEDNERDTLLLNTADIVVCEDSLFQGRIGTSRDSLTVNIEAYPSCYDDSETCYDIVIAGSHNVGGNPRLSLEAVGYEANVDFYRMGGNFAEDVLNPMLTGGDNTHSVLSPSTAPCVISVGATAYRHYVVNREGRVIYSASYPDGTRTPMSSMGPTFDGRVKPDVMAPGISIISSMSSYYIENHPGAGAISDDVSHFDFNGRTYGWNCNSGTSMSAPFVTGIIALWLEACPTLTAEDVLGIFERTCRRYDPDLYYPNIYYGYGEIDAYAGLLDILGIDKITGISSTPTQARLTLADGRLDVQLPSAAATATRITVYSLKGYLLTQETIPAGSSSHSLRLPALRSGDIFVVQIDGEPGNNGSMLIRQRTTPGCF